MWKRVDLGEANLIFVWAKAQLSLATMICAAMAGS